MACILFVEDDEGYRIAMARALTKAGYKVIAAQDYLTALKALDSEEKIDLLLTDIVMPTGINGFALARMAKMRRHEIKVLYLTGYDIPIHEADGRVLRKPVGDEALVSAVNDAVGANRA